MKTKPFTFTIILLIMILSCTNDDDQNAIKATNPDPKTNIKEEDNDIVLARIDYSELTEGQLLPNTIFANDKNGKLIAKIEPKAPGVYELKSKDYNGLTFTLSFYSEGKNERLIKTFYEVPINQKVSKKAISDKPPHNTKLKLNYDFTTTTDYRVDIHGLDYISINSLNDGIGNFSETIKYASYNKILLRSKYKDNKGILHHSHKWQTNYETLSEINLKKSDFTESPIFYPLSDESDDYSVFINMYGVLNGNSYSLNAFQDNAFVNIKGFDYYSYDYSMWLPEISVRYLKRLNTNKLPEKISVTKPNWDISYKINNNSIEINSTGNYSILRISPYFEGSVSEKSKRWDLRLPPKSDSYALIELPDNVKSSFDNFFDDITLFDINYASLKKFKDVPNYNDRIYQVLNDIDEGGSVDVYTKDLLSTEKP